MSDYGALTSTIFSSVPFVFASFTSAFMSRCIADTVAIRKKDRDQNLRYCRDLDGDQKYCNRMQRWKDGTLPETVNLFFDKLMIVWHIRWFIYEVIYLGAWKNCTHRPTFYRNCDS